jgi:hypothetical protein
MGTETGGSNSEVKLSTKDVYVCIHHGVNVIENVLQYQVKKYNWKGKGKVVPVFEHHAMKTYGEWRYRSTHS